MRRPWNLRELYPIESMWTGISTAAQIYGTMFNKQTLENAVPISIVGIRQIMTIENKANYEKMQFRRDTLYIFCHGFSARLRESSFPGWLN